MNSLSTVRQAPPADRHALGVGLEVGPPGHQVEVGPVRAMAVQQDDLLEAVVGEALGDVEHAVHEVLEMGVDRARKVHHVAGVAIAMGRQHQHLLGDDPARARGRSRSGQITSTSSGKCGPCCSTAPHGSDADFAQIDRVVDLGPGQFLVTLLG